MVMGHRIALSGGFSAFFWVKLYVIVLVIHFNAFFEILRLCITLLIDCLCIFTDDRLIEGSVFINDLYLGSSLRNS